MRIREDARLRAARQVLDDEIRRLEEGAIATESSPTPVRPWQVLRLVFEQQAIAALLRRVDDDRARAWLRDAPRSQIATASPPKVRRRRLARRKSALSAQQADRRYFEFLGHIGRLRRKLAAAGPIPTLQKIAGELRKASVPYVLAERGLVLTLDPANGSKVLRMLDVRDSLGGSNPMVIEGCSPSHSSPAAARDWNRLLKQLRQKKPESLLASPPAEAKIPDQPCRYAINFPALGPLAALDEQ